MLFIQILSIIGILLSLYTLYLHVKINNNANYRAICDINDRMSCTKTIKSKAGKIFGIPNGIFGIGFYVLLLILIYLNFINYVFYLAVLGLISTVYFAYELYFKMKMFCLVCNGIYVINVLIFIFALNN